jgi:hypothetical protein
VLWLSACVSPERRVAAREAPWWEDAARLEAAEAIALVEVPRAAPLGYWPRVVIRLDRIDVDDRAFWLADAARTDETLLEEREVVALTDGRAAGEGLLLDPLREALDRMAHAVDLARDRAATPDARSAAFPPLVVVADARVPGTTITRVLYTAAQAGWSEYAVAAVAEGRLRNAWVRDRACDAPAALFLGASPSLSLGSVPIAPVGGGCPASVPDLLAALSSAAERCGPLWDAAAPGRDACFGVSVALGDGPAAEVLPALAALRGSGSQPLAFVAGDGPSGGCAAAVVPDALEGDRLAAACAVPAVRRAGERDRQLLRLLERRPAAP